MQRFLQLHRGFVEAVAIGVVAIGAAHVPPLHIAERLDRWWLDTWSTSRDAPPDDVVVIIGDDPAQLEALATLDHATAPRVLVTTLPTPPSSVVGKHALGPLDLPVGVDRLRRTEWKDGGHLAFERDPIDGAVRWDRPMLDDGTTPSLALRAAQALEIGARASAAAATLSPLGDSRGRYWLRFFESHPFQRLDFAELTPDRIAGRIVIFGPTDEPHRTPVGTLGTPELLAHALASYRTGTSLRPWPHSSVPMVAVALALLALICKGPARSRAAALLQSGASVAALAAGSAALVSFAAIWLPTASGALLLLAGGLTHALQLPRDADERSPRAALRRARRSASQGHLDAAWAAYRQLAAEPALLPEIYSVACALQANGSRREAADLFRRIVQVDGRYEDVAKRLLQCEERVARAAVTEQPPERMPATLGRYELLEPIGKGAMGYVYLGRDPMINRVVAIKVVDLSAEFDADELPAASERFMLEASTVGRLNHPNIVTIYDVGESDGLAFIAMEYVRGRHLSEFTRPDRLLPVPTVLELLARTADALDYAHSENVVHRDIKPANIMYDPASDTLKITDFGIARLADSARTRTGIVLGTPAFMSPEQLEGKNVNGHTDLFALGVSLYELLTGHLPFRGASMTNLMFVIANEPHQPVTAVRNDLPSFLDAIIDRALAKNPSDRYPSGAAMAAALRVAAARLH